jgi:uncharacterized protein DUF4438
MSLDETYGFEPQTARSPRANLDRLIVSTVAGQIANPLVRGSPYRVGRDGVLRVLPSTGGIVLNRRVGDRAVGLAGDHVEPGVSLHNNDREVVGPHGAANKGMMLFACIGNRTRVVTGPATGARGHVIGKHGGINHVIVDFRQAILRRLRIGDRIQITACGQGLELAGFPSVRCLNLSPRLLRRWGISAHRGHLHVPVTHVVPAGIMGSGLGKSDGVLGDCDIQLSDPEIVRKYRLGSLRFGDLVAVCALDNRFGPSVRTGTLTVGVIVHSDSHKAGHGPGLTALLVGPVDILKPVFSPRANVAIALGLRDRIAELPSPEMRERERVWRSLARCGCPRFSAGAVD